MPAARHHAAGEAAARATAARLERLALREHRAISSRSGKRFAMRSVHRLGGTVTRVVTQSAETGCLSGASQERAGLSPRVRWP